MKKSLLILTTSILLCIKIQVFGQNLVPNGSFENFSVCPISTNEIYKAISWFQPHKFPGSNSVIGSSSSDYFNLCSGSSSPVFIPNNVVGYQYANTGNGYIGIATYTIFMNGNAYREYAEIELNQGLVANKKYNLKYYVSLAEGSRYSITKFDAYFSLDSLLFTSSNLYNIPVNPQIQYSGRIDDTLNWVEVNGSFVADGGEKFLTIGNFHDGSLCDSLIRPSGLVVNGSYYYIDDVSLVEDTITGIDEIKKADFSISPVPAIRNVQISSQKIIQEVTLLDIRGMIILQTNPQKENNTIDVSQLDEGIYIVQCKFKNGEEVYKKISIEH